MDKKRIEILAAIIIILAVLALIIFLLLPKKDKGDVVEGDKREDVEIEDQFYEEAISSNLEPEMLPHPIARTFVERFGSFSTDSGYSNVDDVMQIATSAFQGELARLAESARRTDNEVFYGVSTDIVTMDVIAETETTATIQMTTLREESVGSPANTSSRYQDIVVFLVKEGNEWFVNGFEWQ